MHSNIKLNLQRTAMVKFSQCVWKSREIQQELKYIFHENEFYADKVDFNEFMRKEIFSKLKNIDMPARIKSILFYVIKEMGNEIFALHIFLTRSKFFVDKKLNFTEKLYWTPLGKIDLKKIIVENHLGNLRPYMLIQIFEMCLDHCPYEQYMKKVWTPMPILYKNHLLNKMERAAGLWYVNRHMKVADWIKSKFQFAIDGRLLRHFIAAGYCELVNSLWPQLDESTKNALIMDAFDSACDKVCTEHDFMQKRYEEIAVFLFVNMTDSKKLEVVRDPQRRGWRILQRLMSWPWLSLLMPTLELFWININQDNDINVLNDFVNGLIAVMIEETKFGYSSVMLSILREVWQRMPTELKFRFDFTDTVVKLMKCGSLSSLRDFVNCPLFELEKDDIVKTMIREYVKIRTENTADRDEQLEEFVVGVFETNKEQEVFRETIRGQIDYVGSNEKKNVKHDLL